MDLIESKIDKEINRHPWELSKVQCLIKEVKKYHKRGNILDIGCGDSYFDYQLMNKIDNFDEFYGIDIFIEKEIIDNRYCVVNNYNKLKKLKFDTILMFDLLEHIENDKDFLNKTVYPLLKDNGKIILTVPAYQSLFSKHDLELKHYRRYNIKMIKDIVSNSKLKIVDYHYFYFTLIIIRFFSKLLKQDNPVNTWKHKEDSFYSKFITTILNIDYFICEKIKKNPFGLSLFVVLEKK